MASIRKRMSKVWASNDDASAATSKSNSLDPVRRSFDSGYYSAIYRNQSQALSGATTLVGSGTDRSPERSPKILHKSVSATFSGALKAFSNTVRSGTSYIYPTAGKTELPTHEWDECQTPSPKKESRRSSFMSSVRSRKSMFSPRKDDARDQSACLPISPVPVEVEKAPTLDVDIPGHSLTEDGTKRTASSASADLLAGVKLPAGPKNLWPGPTRVDVGQSPPNHRPGSLTLHSSAMNDPYVDQGDGTKQGISFITSALADPSFQPSNHYLSEDKGYLSEIESNGEIAESDGLSPTCPKNVAAGSPKARTSSSRHHSEPADTHIRFDLCDRPSLKSIPARGSSSMSPSLHPRTQSLDGAVERIENQKPYRPSYIPSTKSSKDGLEDVLASQIELVSEPKAPYMRHSSDVYEADAELSETSPRAAGMGSRASWERDRADREKRYHEILDMEPATASDKDWQPELELKRSPSKRLVPCTEGASASIAPVKLPEDSHAGTSIGAAGHTLSTLVEGDLRYAVEAIEKPAYPADGFRYDIEAIERPSIASDDETHLVAEQDSSPLYPSDTINITEMSPVISLEPSPVYNPSSPMPSSDIDVELSTERPIFELSDTADAIENAVLPPGDLHYAVEAIDRPSITTFDGLETVFQQRPLLSLEQTEEDQGTSLEGPKCLPLQSSSPPGVPSAPGIPANPKYPMMTMRLTAEEIMSIQASDMDSQATRHFSSESTDASESSSHAQQSYPEPEDAYEAGLKAAGFRTPKKFRQRSDMYHGMGRRILSPSNVESRLSTPFEHTKTISALSDETDDSCAMTTRSPSCNVSPPYPCLHVRSEPAGQISDVLDALADHGNEVIPIAGPANSGIKPLRPSSQDGPGGINQDGGPEMYLPACLVVGTLPENSVQMSLVERLDLHSPVSGPRSSPQPQDTTPCKTFNAARMPDFSSTSPMSRKTRRKQKRLSESNTDNVPATKDSGKGRDILADSNPSDLNGMRSPANDASAPFPTSSSPQRHQNSRRRGRISRYRAGGSVKESKTLTAPKLKKPTLHTDHQLGANVGKISPPLLCSVKNDGVQSSSGKKAVCFSKEIEIIGNGGGEDLATPTGPKNEEKPLLEEEKPIALQRDLEEKSNRAFGRFIDKMKGEAIVKDQIYEDETHTEDKPRWRVP